MVIAPHSLSRLLEADPNSHLAISFTPVFGRTESYEPRTYHNFIKITPHEVRSAATAATCGELVQRPPQSTYLLSTFHCAIDRSGMTIATVVLDRLHFKVDCVCTIACNY